MARLPRKGESTPDVQKEDKISSAGRGMGENAMLKRASAREDESMPLLCRYLGDKSSRLSEAEAGARGVGTKLMLLIPAKTSLRCVGG